MRSCFVLVAACLAALARPGAAYPTNYLSAKLGAGISTTAKLLENHDVKAVLSDGPITRDGFAFAKDDQPQVFTVDFGRERPFDRVEFGTGNAGGDRNARFVRIEVASKSADGPYKQVFEKTDLGVFQTLRLPLVKARWVRFDLGEGTQGAIVRGLRIYKGYEHPRLARVTKLLYERIKPGVPGLERFYAAARKGDWSRACGLLHAYYAAKHKPEGPPNPKFDPARARDIADGNLDYAGLKRTEKVPIDWSYERTTDWYEHRNFLNRGSPIGVPVVAYYNTGDRKWLDLARAVFYDWIDANPKPTIMSGADYPGWRTLDTAARSGWVMHAFPMLTASKGVEDELWANWLYSIWEIADYLKNDDFTGGNWLAKVTSAVMGIALDFPEFADQKMWLAYGKDGFERNVMRDVHPDGKEMEDAPGYVCFAYSGMLSTLEALDKVGIAVNPEARERMNKVQDYLGAVTQPDGNMPAIGDWGGGAAYPLPRSMAFFKREDIRYILTRGKEGTMPAAASVNFPYGQWSVMRSAYDEKPYENARQLVFKSSFGAHGHNDVLTITNYAYGRELLIDAGIRSYERADLERYPATPYHNTITVDGKNQSNTHGKTEKWFSNAGLDYVFGTHNGYKNLTHRRGVVFVKPDYWIVLDQVVGEGSHTYDQNWHFAEDAAVSQDLATKAVHTAFPRDENKAGGWAKDGNLIILPVDPESVTSEQTEFLIAKKRMGSDKDETPSWGWKYSKSGPAPVTLDAVLYPYQGASVPDVKVKRLRVECAASTDLTALQVGVGPDTDYVFVSRAGPVAASVPSIGLSLDGEIVIVRAKDGKPVRVSGANVRSVSFGGQNLYSKADGVDVSVE